ncbi:ATP-binding cassette domain-containing protein, partial [Nostoc sp. NIES-2111]
IVGPSGAGKSTIIGLICRFYNLEIGEIYIDDYPLKELNLRDWREQIAIVSQDVHMFSTTVLANIAYGRLDATEEEVIAAAKLANAHQFISELPQGYDTKVGDRGVRLSGGQRQRIALARAIVRNPEILILDEATNALDSISEHLIQEALNTLSDNRTVIVIAHRLATIEQADKIIVLNAGQVVEQGNLQDLLKLNGLFAQLYDLQHRSAHI